MPLTCLEFKIEVNSVKLNAKINGRNESIILKVQTGVVPGDVGVVGGGKQLISLLTSGQWP